MIKILSIIFLTCLLASFALSADFYASTTGSGSTCSLAAPCDLQTLIADTGKCNANTFWMRGGTYHGRFIASLDGCTLRSYCAGLTGGCAANPSEWAVIDGDIHTTLNGAINASQTNMTVTDGTKILPSGGGDEISIDLEVIKFCAKSGNNLTSCGRAASGTVGGATSHANGATVYQSGDTFYVQGDNSTYRDFEVTNGITDRNETAVPAFTYAIGVFNVGSSNNFINLIIHDNGVGIFTSSASSNTLIYGDVIYNNGATHNDGSGYGISTYLENPSGYSRIYDTYELNCFSINFQGYGVSGPFVGGDVQGSVFANAGVYAPPLKQNMIYGPASVVSPTANVQDSHFYHTPNTNSFSIAFGYGAGITSGSFTNNYIYGSGSAFEAQTVGSLTFTGNKFYSTGSGDRYTLVGTAGYTWDNNTYYNTTTQLRFNKSGSGSGDFNFTNWKPIFGYDAHSTATGSALPDQAIVRPNAYETGRANVIVYAPSGASSINVNLSTTGLVNGQSYIIKNGFNWNGSNVATGVYNSSIPTISVPLNAVAATVATPTGWGSTAATTAPNFALLTVLPSSAQGTPAVFTGSVKTKGSVIFH